MSLLAQSLGRPPALGTRTVIAQFRGPFRRNTSIFRMESSFSRQDPLKIKNPVIPLGSKILVSGANGFIASHVIDQLLAAGYNVRGSVRNLEKSSWLLDLMNQKHGDGRLELVKVEEMAREGAFAEAVRGVQGAIHVASIMSWDPDPNKVIPPVIASNLNFMKAAATEPGLKRFVFTSSSHAAIDRRPNVVYQVTENSWNDAIVENAWKQTPGEPKQGFFVYGASKAQGEKAMWKWYEENRPHYQFSVVIPNHTIGKVLSLEHQVDTQGLQFFRWIWEGDVEKFVKLTPAQHFVDVQDVGRVHVAAIAHEEVGSERLFAFAKPYTCNDVLAAFRKRFPDRQFPENFPNPPQDLSIVPKEKAERLLKDMGRDSWTAFDDCLARVGEAFAAADAKNSLSH